MATPRRKKRKKRKWFLLLRRRRRKKKRNKWPRILLLSKGGYINYKIPKIPLRTNIGYYILPSL